MMLRESNPKNEWRSPQGKGTLLLRDEQYSPTKKENATHGQIYRTGRTRVKLYARGHWPEREAPELTRSGNERSSADRSAQGDPRGPRKLHRCGFFGQLVAEGGTDVPSFDSRGVKHRPKGTRRALSMPESGIVGMTKYDRARMIRP